VTAPNATQSEPTGEDWRPLDAAIGELATGAKRWAATPLGERAAILNAVHAAVAVNAQQWITTASSIKRLAPSSALVGEEWLSGPYAVLTAVAALARSVSAVSAGVSPLAGAKTRTAPGGRVAFEVLPANAYDRLLLNGFTAQVWMPPGTSADAARSQAGLATLRPEVNGGVGLVLGAGNITAIAVLDVLYEIVANNRAALLKLNPVMARMQPVFEAALAALIDFGVLRVVGGGGEVGSYLAHHPGIAHVHVTGSAVTHDAVVYGAGADGVRRKATGQPLLGKPITSELGGVSPIIVVPSRWSRRDLRFQAEHVATQRLHNGGYNCIAGQTVVLSAEWPQKEAFLNELRRAIDRAPYRPAWYPGSDERLERAAESYPYAQRLGGGGRLLIDIRAGEDASAIENTEYFAPVLGVIEVQGSGRAFLDSAVAKVNTDFAGTLGVNLIADPKVITSLGSGFDDAIAALRYGTVAINAWTGVGFLATGAPWGAFAGNTIDDVGSGIGVVHNALLIDSPERTVVRGPFRPFPRSLVHGEFALSPKPPWFVTARTAATTGRRMAAFAANPSWRKLPGIFVSAFRA
jgi:aldehyde dehydrogenase (NAD(P)+)